MVIWSEVHIVLDFQYFRSEDTMQVHPPTCLMKLFRADQPLFDVYLINGSGDLALAATNGYIDDLSSSRIGGQLSLQNEAGSKVSTCLMKLFFKEISPGALGLFLYSFVDQELHSS